MLWASSVQRCWDGLKCPEKACLLFSFSVILKKTVSFPSTENGCATSITVQPAFSLLRGVTLPASQMAKDKPIICRPGHGYENWERSSACKEETRKWKKIFPRPSVHSQLATHPIENRVTFTWEHFRDSDTIALAKIQCKQFKLI